MSTETASKSAAWQSLGRFLGGDRVVVERQVRLAWAHRHEAISRAERELDDVLAVGLIGGTGVGKSTLINALAGAVISAAGDRRPTTDRVVVYRHAETDLPERIPALHLGAPQCTHRIDSLQQVVLLDFPDFDSVEQLHRDILDQYLPHLDLLMVVVDDVKYGDHRLYELLRGLHQSRDNAYFVLNKVDGLEARYGNRWEKVVFEIAADLRTKLVEHAGWAPRDDAVLPLSALAALRHATEPAAGGNVGEFPRLVELLEDYRVERRRRVVKEMNVESRKRALADSIDRVIAGAAVRRVRAAASRWQQRRREVEAAMTELGAGAMSRLERRRAVRRRLRDNVSDLGFAMEIFSALRRRGYHRAPDGGAVSDLSAARWAEHYAPFLDAVRNSRAELDLDLYDLAEFGEIEDSRELFSAAALQLQTGLASWEASLRRQSPLRDHAVPVLLLLGWLGFRYFRATAPLNITTLAGAVVLVLAGYAGTAWMSWRRHARRLERMICRAESAAARAARQWGDRQLDPPTEYLERWLAEHAELSESLAELVGERDPVVPVPTLSSEA